MFARQQQKDKKNQDIKNLILQSGIDFSCFGWVSEVAELINISPQKVAKKMIKIMPNFYNKCYKTKKAIKLNECMKSAVQLGPVLPFL